MSTLNPPPLETDWTFSGARGPKSRFMRRGELHQHLKTMCHFHLFSAQPLNLKQHAGCLFMKWHPYSCTVKIQRADEEREWQSSDSPLFADFLSHMRYWMRMSGIVLTWVCVCVCTWGKGGECVSLVDMCTQPLFSECEQCLRWTWSDVPNSRDCVDGYYGFKTGGGFTHTLENSKRCLHGAMCPFHFRAHSYYYLRKEVIVLVTWRLLIMIADSLKSRYMAFWEN